MSEDTAARGRLTIDPPLTWAECTGLPVSTPDGGPNGWDVYLLLTEEQEPTDNGVAVTWTAGAIAVTSYPFREVLPEVQAIVEAIDDSHSITGHIECVYARGEDIWRIAVRDGRAVEVRPVWPDQADRYVLATAAGGDAILLGPHGQVYTTGDTAGLAETDGWQRLYRRVPVAGGGQQ